MLTILAAQINLTKRAVLSVNDCEKLFMNRQREYICNTQQWIHIREKARIMLTF